VSRDFGKLKHILNLLTPGLVFAASGAGYAEALNAAMPPDAELVVTHTPPPGRTATDFADLASDDTAQADAAHARADGDTIAKFLFTSGSTGLPKGVINTQRMLTSNLAMIGASFPCLADEPPVLVDWLPWNHTFGGNHNTGIALAFGGTLYIDAGKPAPGAIETTVANLREIAPTIYFNVPKGYEALVHWLRREPALCDTFFSRLKMNFFAGASLPQHVFDALDELAVETTGERILMMSGLGATETAPSAMFCTPETSHAGGVGLPVPGCELKLVPNGGKLEARFRGPNVTPGYWRDAALTAAAFDGEGFYRIGDALRFADVNEPRKGFMFDGRVTEDFKLSSGTWVSTGPLRARFIAAFAPFVRDIVVAGHDRDELTGIVLPDVDACRSLGEGALRTEFTQRLAAFAKAASGSSTKIARIILLEEPPSIDAGEVTDKGSINQRAVLAHRAALVETLYATPTDARVISADGPAVSPGP
jgi:feruloyl-CoA synthase